MRTGKHLKKCYPYWHHSMLSALSLQQPTNSFSGSVLSEILVSADVIAAKSVESVLKGQHFWRAVRELQLVYETLQRRLIEMGIFKEIHLPEKLKQQLVTKRNLSVSSQQQLSRTVKGIWDSPNFASFVEIVNKVVESKGNSMANYWFDLLEMMEIFMRYIHSMKIKDWNMFKDWLRMIIPAMQIYDKNNYDEWLVEF